MAWVDEGFQQQQRIAEAIRPIPHQTAFAQRENTRGQVRVMGVGQDQEATVVGDQVQTVILMTEIPADPGIPRRTLPGGGGEAQQGHPHPVPGSDIPQGMAESSALHPGSDAPAATTGTAPGRRRPRVAPGSLEGSSTMSRIVGCRDALYAADEGLFRTNDKFLSQHGNLVRGVSP